ncbi:thiamine kinase [Mangrovibacter plantisponsor]|uniref:Thiamine kinase n=1 Tax=Mangrovibacter plantisponsor TaxID=451513 RepID=A0A317Q772_9ENTR|nr:thiamine kinase [Mangrovibacter plantisponsor]PWW09960.1 thiamine kinase [Mangrovibacter plantisponsor]
MKLSGLVKVPYSKRSDAGLHHHNQASHPAAFAAGSVSAIQGLSGNSVLVENTCGKWVRRTASTHAELRRQYRALQLLPHSLAPAPVFMSRPWLYVEWVEGQVAASWPPADVLARTLSLLHHQPLFGWRIVLLPLLQRYWQNAAPSRRTVFWLAQLKKCQRIREPGPIRLAPLHMDIHPGNIVHQGNKVRLIDWEYAGDGDVGLELATLAIDEPPQFAACVASYARQMHLNEVRLGQQINRWLPWVNLLMASWYEYRWQETQTSEFIQLADQAWCRLKHT